MLHHVDRILPSRRSGHQRPDQRLSRVTGGRGGHRSKCPRDARQCLIQMIGRINGNQFLARLVKRHPTGGFADPRFQQPAELRSQRHAMGGELHAPAFSPVRAACCRSNRCQTIPNGPVRSVALGMGRHDHHRIEKLGSGALLDDLQHLVHVTDQDPSFRDEKSPPRLDAFGC